MTTRRGARVTSAGRALMKAAAAAADRARRRPRGVVILLYHRVGARSGLQIDLPTGLFEEQVAELSASRPAVDLDGALDVLADGRLPSADPVAVTFDDGTADFVDDALPVLAASRVPATLYVATSFVETGERFPDGARPASWAALADAVSTGLVTVGSHTHGHRLLDRLPLDEIEDELDRSRQLIEERLGVPARHFAYPKALPASGTGAQAVARRFASAALAGTRSNRYGAADPFRLARSPIQVSDGMRYFRHKLAGGMELEDRLRRIVDRRRYADVVT